jgi:hypothetical protein
MNLTYVYLYVERPYHNERKFRWSSLKHLFLATYFLCDDKKSTLAFSMMIIITNAAERIQHILLALTQMERTFFMVIMEKE